MANIHYLQPSFSAGELSPALAARSDLQKYSMGLTKCYNFIIHPYGGASNRPGTEFIAGAKYVDATCRLLPFQYNEEQAYVLEFGHEYIRFFMNGGQIYLGNDPYEIASPYQHTELSGLKITQSADIIFIAHPNHRPKLLSRIGHTDWTLTDYEFKNGPFRTLNHTKTSTIAPSAKTGNIALTASTDLFYAGHVGSLWQIIHEVAGQTLTIAFTSATTSSAMTGKGTWKAVTHGTWKGQLHVEKSVDGGSTWEIVRSYSSADDNNIIDNDTISELCQIRLRMASYTSGTCNADLSWWAYEQAGNVQITAVTDAKHANATVKEELGGTAATYLWAEGSWSDVRGWPSTVAFYQDRLFWANTAAQPQTLWSSMTSDYSNFLRKRPVEDDNAIEITLNASEMNAIKNIVSLSEIIAMTAAAEFRVGSGNGGVLTPTSIYQRAQGYRGCSNITPVVIGNRVLFVQRMGSTIRDIGYDYASDSYVGDNLSILTNHFFDRHEIIDMDYQQSPDSILWCIRDDGRLLGLTYIREQEVWAWHQHETDGKFESICSISGSGRNEVWFVVSRTVNGSTVRHIERLSDRLATTYPKDSWFVDSGLYYEGEPVDEITGLDHLEGCTVSILADGNVLPQQTVTSGTVTLGSNFSKVIIGLPYTSDLETLSVELGSRDGTSRGRQKHVSSATLVLRESRGAWVGSAFDKLTELKMRSNENYGDPIELYSGDKEITIRGNFSKDGKLCIRQTDPLPITVLAIALNIEPGG